jgi:transcriptional regulator with XRE-family HTH domain
MLGKRIKDLRERQGISREALAKWAKLDVGELARIEEDNVEQLPTPQLLQIADRLRLKKAADFTSLMQLNGVSRRFQTYCLGLAKTGTVSLTGIFGHYRSMHEFRQWDTHQMVIQYNHGRISPSEYRAFIQDRDVAGRLEMDAAHFNRHYIEFLAEEFPAARFICLIRDCFSWLNSKINYFTLPERAALQSQELPNGMPFDLPRGACGAKEELVRNFHQYIDWPLSFWASEYRAMFEKLPPGRSLIIRTHEIADNIENMAQLVGVPPDTLLKENSHLNKGSYHLNILSQYDRGFLKEKFHLHCGELMARYFPGYALEDYLDGNPIPAHPELSRSIEDTTHRAAMNWRSRRLIT